MPTKESLARIPVLARRRRKAEQTRTQKMYLIYLKNQFNTNMNSYLYTYTVWLDRIEYAEQKKLKNKNECIRIQYCDLNAAN